MGHKEWGPGHAFNQIWTESGHSAQVEAYEVFGFMCHITTKALPQDAMPKGVVLPVKSLIWAWMSFSMFYVSSARVAHPTEPCCIFDRCLWLHMVIGTGAGQSQPCPGGGAGEPQTPEAVAKPGASLNCTFKNEYKLYFITIILKDQNQDLETNVSTVKLQAKKS